MKELSGKRNKVTTTLLFLLLFLSSCAYRERVQPITLPSASANGVVIDGVHIVATSYEDEKAAAKAFGFDARKAGLLPIEVTFQNDGSVPVHIVSDQTFLIDQQQQAWPINSLERTYKRAKDYTDIGETVKGSGKPSLLMGAAGAIAGAAIGIVTGENVGSAAGKGAVIGAAVGAASGGIDAYSKAGREIKGDLREKTLTNRQILPGQLAYGTLFFPGFKDEAHNATHLKLTMDFGGHQRAITLNLTAPVN